MSHDCTLGSIQTFSKPVSGSAVPSIRSFRERPSHLLRSRSRLEASVGWIKKNLSRWSMTFYYSPLSICQNSNVTPRLQGQNCNFCLSRNPEKRLTQKQTQTKYRKMTRKPLSESRKTFNIPNVSYWQTADQILLNVVDQLDLDDIDHNLFQYPASTRNQIYH